MITRSKNDNNSCDDTIVIGGMRHLSTREGWGERDDRVVEEVVADRLAEEPARLWTGNCEVVLS
jgi:hypothetical protein